MFHHHTSTRLDSRHVSRKFRSQPHDSEPGLLRKSNGVFSVVIPKLVIRQTELARRGCLVAVVLRQCVGDQPAAERIDALAKRPVADEFTRRQHSDVNGRDLIGRVATGSALDDILQLTDVAGKPVAIQRCDRRARQFLAPE